MGVRVNRVYYTTTSITKVFIDILGCSQEEHGVDGGRGVCLQDDNRPEQANQTPVVGYGWSGEIPISGSYLLQRSSGSIGRVRPN
jgi:hypothetical protein